jgi:hypothetical protein
MASIGSDEEECGNDRHESTTVVVLELIDE